MGRGVDTATARSDHLPANRKHAAVLMRRSALPASLALALVIGGCDDEGYPGSYPSAEYVPRTLKQLSSPYWQARLVETPVERYTLAGAADAFGL